MSTMRRSDLTATMIQADLLARLRAVRGAVGELVASHRSESDVPPADVGDVATVLLAYIQGDDSKREVVEKFVRALDVLGVPPPDQEGDVLVFVVMACRAWMKFADGAHLTAVEVAAIADVTPRAVRQWEVNGWLRSCSRRGERPARYRVADVRLALEERRDRS